MKIIKRPAIASVGAACFILYFSSAAETTVFIDPCFPYRVVCKTEWVQETKNDSMLVLKNSTPGKKTRFQLQKYRMDTSFDVDSKDWSRLNFAVNKELALAMGRLVFIDTSASKKLGNFRAFEIFAFFREKSGNDSIWWAEYSRWTDHDGFGYIASIIGDTIDIKQNYASYKALMDSVTISQLTTRAIYDGRNILKSSGRSVRHPSSARYTVSGRKMPGATLCAAAIVANKNWKQCLFK
jgi:hypothetical protein